MERMYDPFCHFLKLYRHVFVWSCIKRILHFMKNVMNTIQVWNEMRAIIINNVIISTPINIITNISINN